MPLVNRYSFLWIALLFCVACSTGHCRRDGKGVLEKVDPKPPAGYEEQNLGSITVAKPDGSRQCGVKMGEKLEDMASELLNGVEILSSEKKSDGLLRIQSCGAETGMLNTYTIRHQDLRKAQMSGFTILKSDEQN